MNFEEQVKSFAKRTKSIMNGIETEEATKTSIIMPFFQTLGYDVFNPSEFVPEFTADVGIKKGEKVDYAILNNKAPVILIECKSIKEELTKHDSQLFRYFGTTSAKFAILTNGIIYRFYTDLDEPNKMDEKPFLEINMLDLKEAQIPELKKFHKDNFDLNQIIDTASELKYIGLMRNVIKEEFSNPSDEFVRLVLGNGVYDGVKTQNVIDRYKPMLKKSLTGYINDLVNDKIQTALNNDDATENEAAITGIATEINGIETEDININKVHTTDDELESYYIVKSILRETVSPSRIFYKDTQSYFGILIDNKVTRWLCRICFRESGNFIVIPNEIKEGIKYPIDTVNDIYKLSSALIERAKSIV
ncbi:MAG: type I restriction endonuclease [Sedimentibacter sp.]|uniref:type I restriction endonuclease n=1 Tax=Sedimentibacter sp. TaxID=1960295 RepID=UPI0029816389|nr:type I restriction endonuclease [Sedimentibacter sp.]MDW5299448.1 type I restriction endonuclease [Sedimentibacter sp.]